MQDTDVWEEVQAPNSTKFFYHNPRTNATSWEIPGTIWRKAEASGKHYFINMKTKATQWIIPPEVQKFYDNGMRVHPLEKPVEQSPEPQIGSDEKGPLLTERTRSDFRPPEGKVTMLWGIAGPEDTFAGVVKTKKTKSVEPTVVDEKKVSKAAHNNISDKKELKKFWTRVRSLRKWSMIATFCHIFVTLVVAIMGFSSGGKPDGNTANDKQILMSPSIVFCAFGCLNTVIFAVAEAYNVREGTANMEKMPSWNWHNTGFLQAVANVFFLSFFMIPAFVTYMIHALGESFFSLVAHLANHDPSTFAVISFHVLSGALVFFVDVTVVLRTTTKLRTFQQREEDDKEETADGQKADDAAVAKKKQAEEDEDIDEDEDERTIEKSDKVVLGISIVFHLLHAMDLVIIAARNVFNSGTFLTTAIFILLLCVWIWQAFKNRRRTSVTESFVLNYRLATILHLFCFLLFFWVALCILILQERFDSSFFATLGELSDNRSFLIALLIILFFVYMIAYSVVLYVHSRSMWSLDEIHSLFLAARLQEKLVAEAE